MKSRYNGYSFPLRDTVTREKVQFHNRYGIQLAGDLYLPKGSSGKLAAVAVCGGKGVRIPFTLPLPPAGLPAHWAVCPP